MRLQPLPFQGAGLHLLLLPVLSLRGRGPGRMGPCQGRPEDLELLRLPADTPHLRVQAHSLQVRGDRDNGCLRPQDSRGPRRDALHVQASRQGADGRGSDVRRREIRHRRRALQDTPQARAPRRAVQKPEHEPELQGHTRRSGDRHDTDPAGQGRRAEEPGQPHEPHPPEAQGGYCLPGDGLRQALRRLRCAILLQRVRARAGHGDRQGECRFPIEEVRLRRDGGGGIPGGDKHLRQGHRQHGRGEDRRRRCDPGRERGMGRVLRIRAGDDQAHPGGGPRDDQGRDIQQHPRQDRRVQSVRGGVREALRSARAGSGAACRCGPSVGGLRRPEGDPLQGRREMPDRSGQVPQDSQLHRHRPPVPGGRVREVRGAGGRP